MLNFVDTKGRTFWIAASQAALGRYVPELHEKGERYRIVSRTVSALGGSVRVFVLVIFPRD